MKIDDLDLSEEVEEEDDDDEDDTLEADLCEAKELLENCLEVLESQIRNKTSPRNRNAMKEKEIEDLALEITGFLNQWESETVVDIVDLTTYDWSE